MNQRMNSGIHQNNPPYILADVDHFDCFENDENEKMGT